MTAREDDGGLAGRLARFSVDHPNLVLLAVLVMALLGAVSAMGVPVDAVPDITNVQVVVLTDAPGLGPVQVEELVTHPVEIGLAGLPGLREVRSTSRAGLSSVTAIFEDDVDPTIARLEVSQRMPTIREDLPSVAGTPEIGPFTTGLGEVYHFTVRWPGHTPVETHTVVDWEVAHPLRHVPGVVEVNLWGGEVKQYQVVLDAQRMAARSVTLAMVSDALERSNRSVGAGAIERDAVGLVVRGEALLRDEREIGEVAVRVVAGVPVLVRDVADVRVGGGVRLGAATADSDGEVVYVMVQMLAGANARTTVRDVRERLDELVRELPPGVRVEPFYDRADFVGRVLETVSHNLAEGAALVCLVLLLALGDLRAGLLVASLIPLSALGAAVFVKRLGVTGNLMSLGAVDFGLLVDGAVVVVEHAMVRAALDRVRDAKDVARDAAGEVARPVAFGVAIIALVYVPVLALEGVEGRMFRPMAMVVLSALATALVLSLTFVPAMAPALVRIARRSAVDHAPVAVRFARRVYEPLLDRVMARPLAAVLAVLAVVALSVALGSRQGGEFMPRLDEGSIALQLTRPPSTSLEEGVRGTLAVERALAPVPEVSRVVSRTGSPAVATDLMGPEQSDVFIMLRPPATWRRPYDREALVEDMEARLRVALPGCDFAFTQPIEMRMSELLSGIRSDVGVRVFGADLGELRRLGDRVAEVLRRTRGGEDVRAEQIDGLPTMAVRPDRPALARSGLRSDDVMAYVQAFRAGVPVGRIYEGERRFDLVLRVGAPDTMRPGAVGDLALVTDEGSASLGSVATITEEFGPAQVSHEQGRRRLVVEANVRGRDLASYVQEVQARLARLPRPRGYEIRVGGQYQNLARASQRLAIVGPLVLAAILVMLRASLGSWRSALLVFVNVPVAVSGGVIALVARAMPLSITAGVGFIALAGIAVLNGLVLCTEIDHQRALGAGDFDAARAAARSRLRPVLTTATVAALGFVPMALAKGTGSEVQRPLATVIIGGLVTATAATLLLLPAVSGWRRAKE
jgi:cobalt-zinc-cadmium resistance protein CzcA